MITENILKTIFFVYLCGVYQFFKPFLKFETQVIGIRKMTFLLDYISTNFTGAEIMNDNSCKFIFDLF